MTGYILLGINVYLLFSLLALINAVYTIERSDIAWEGVPAIRSSVNEDICVWPDDSWCFYTDLEEYSWKSDDFYVLHFDTPEYDAFFDQFFGAPA